MTTISTDEGLTAVGTIVTGHAEPHARGRFARIFLWFCVAWMVAISLLALLAPVLPFVKDPQALGAGEPLAGPNSTNWFGTDALGRDVFAQVAWGGRVSLLVGLVGTVVGMSLGGLLGLLAGYYRRGVDGFVSGLIAVMLSIPALVLVSFIVALRGQDLANVMLAVCILAVPSLARIVRSATLQYAEREFVQAAHVLGARDRRILFREILPNVMPAMVSFAFLALGIIIVAEGALSFLGLSVERPTPTWGKVVSDGLGQMEDAPHLVLFPSLVLFLTVLALNYIGDDLLKRFDIRESML